MLASCLRRRRPLQLVQLAKDQPYRRFDSIETTLNEAHPIRSTRKAVSGLAQLYPRRRTRLQLRYRLTRPPDYTSSHVVRNEKLYRYKAGRRLVMINTATATTAAARRRRRYGHTRSGGGDRRFRTRRWRRRGDGARLRDRGRRRRRRGRQGGPRTVHVPTRIRSPPHRGTQHVIACGRRSCAASGRRGSRGGSGQGRWRSRIRLLIPVAAFLSFAGILLFMQRL